MAWGPAGAGRSPLSAAALPGQRVVLARRGALDVSVRVVQERLAADLRLLLLQLAGGRVQLLLRFLRGRVV